MATTIQIKRSSTASGVPLATDLAVGELAVNLVDKRLFTKQSDGTIIELSTSPTDLDAATLRIDGVEITASATELNKLDGFTGSTTELNILDGVTATTAEINKLDGFTGSTAELNFVDGVTSNIQTQLNSKASATASPTITLGGDLSGSATLTNLGNATLTATVADDSHNHIISNVDGLQTALDGKATSAQGALADSAVQPDDNVTFGTGNFSGDVGVTGTVTADNVSFGTGDFSGTVTADGLVIDGDVDIQDTTLSNTNALLTLRDNRTTTDEENYVLAITRQNSATPSMYIGNNDLNEAVIAGNNTSVLFGKDVSGAFNPTMKVGGNGDVSFYEDTGTTAKMVWDASAEKLLVPTVKTTGNIQLDGDNAGLFIKSGVTGTEGFVNWTFNTDTTVYSKMGIAYDDRATTGLLIDSLYPITFDSVSQIVFKKGGTERARIDSSGNLLVGRTNTWDFSSAITGGAGIDKSGYGYFSRTSGSGTPLYVQRPDSSGNMVELYQGTSAVGSIGATSSQLYIGSTVSGVRFGSSTVFPANSDGSSSDADTDLGTSSVRFKDLYLSGGVYLGGTGSANKLDDYEEGEWTPTLLGWDGVVYSSQIGRYTKVGRLVTLHFFLQVSDVGTYNSNSRVAGLPFNANALSTTFAVSTQPSLMTLCTEARDDHIIAIYNGGATIFIYDKNGNPKNGNTYQAGALSGTISYLTNS